MSARFSVTSCLGTSAPNPKFLSRGRSGLIDDDLVILRDDAVFPNQLGGWHAKRHAREGRDRAGRCMLVSRQSSGPKSDGGQFS
ncbi:hypothetical protein OAN307_c15550 [Octadecabacter antarcticus 307]|uniref:Uncharacterized protein n=1 Tax=Octadecabacter antarcticus 307 TaxID=391626 RepID=M9R626_9RHOB|nr:hypothetical protein OAN307_c15550 [Octadecabacter antarcticus 307]